MKQRSFLFRREPNWFVNRTGIRNRIPGAVASWLYETKSLTARLRTNCAPYFEVKVLTQSWQKPYRGEAKLLNQPLYRRSLVREVRLEWNDEPLIVARTIIPSKTLKGAHRRLSSLGTRPLGEVIFSYPGLSRAELDLACLKPDHWSPAAFESLTIERQTVVWGRRTLYSIGGPQLLVCEFFLPFVLEHGNAKPK